MTVSPTSGPALPRPAPAADQGALDERFYDLVEGRFRRLMRDNPIAATYFGVHDVRRRPRRRGPRDVAGRARGGSRTPHRDRGARSGRAVRGRPVRARPRDPQPAAEHLRDRRVADLGAALARARHDRRRVVPAVRARPRPARRASGGDRRPAGGGAPPSRGARTRSSGHRFGCGRGSRSSRPRRCPPSSTRWSPPAGACSARPNSGGSSGPPRRRRSRSSSTARGSRARSPVAPTSGRRSANATTSWSRSGRSTASTPTRSSRSASSSWPRTTRRRRAAAREIDPTAGEAEVSTRVKADHPAPSTKHSRRTATGHAPSAPHLIEHDIATVPADERIEVIETPEYLRNVMPFAAYFVPAEFDPRPEGRLHRHALGGRRPERDARAQPCLDQQHQHPRGLPGAPSAADVAGRHPSLTRLLTDAPSSSRAGACTASR